MNQITKLLLTIFLIITAYAPVHGCKCATQAEEFRYAAKTFPLVFSGRLVSVKNKELTGLAGTYTMKVFKFVPIAIWRGAKADTITLVSGNNNCDVTLPMGHYIIYTDSTHDLITCDRIISDNIDKESQRLNRLFTRKRFKKLQVAS